MEQISSTVKKNRRALQQANQFTPDRRGRRPRGAVVRRPERDAGSRIFSQDLRIISVIDEYRAQTTAGPTGVEPARAGKAGALCRGRRKCAAGAALVAGSERTSRIITNTGPGAGGVGWSPGRTRHRHLESIKKWRRSWGDRSRAPIRRPDHQINTSLTQMDR